jgi:Predicted soluble lytic transglycosylase fused to an ABC-type amino acid-binding protein
MVFCLFYIPIRKSHNTKPEFKTINNDTLKCNILLDKSIYSKGFNIGYFYDLLQNFSSFKNCTINKNIAHDSLDFELNELLKNKTDLLVIDNSKDSVPAQYKDIFLSSIPLDSKNNIVCITTKNNSHIIQNINSWFVFFKNTPEYKNIISKYTKKYIIPDNFGAPLSKTAISPYDEYVKKYANILGWDWRLICSIMYQESKFKAGATSKRGAYGLMQIKEDVAKKYKIDDIYNPEQNIKAGIMHLNRIQKKYLKMGVDTSNIVNITLVAYNCGEGRMKDLMNLAKDLNLNPLLWSSIEQVIPLLREKEHYSKDFILFGQFNGKETLSFISNIISRYNTYSESVKK